MTLVKIYVKSKAFKKIPHFLRNILADPCECGNLYYNGIMYNVLRIICLYFLSLFSFQHQPVAKFP